MIAPAPAVRVHLDQDRFARMGPAPATTHRGPAGDDDQLALQLNAEMVPHAFKNSSSALFVGTPTNGAVVGAELSVPRCGSVRISWYARGELLPDEAEQLRYNLENYGVPPNIS